MKKRNKKITALILFMITLCFSCYLLYKIHKLSIIPIKYFIVGIVFLLLINIISFYYLRAKSKLGKMIGCLLSVFLITITIVGCRYINETNKFLNNLFNNKIKEITTYNIIVLKNSYYEDIYKLDKKKLGYNIEDKNKKEALLTINELISIESTNYEDIYELYNDLLNKKVEAILIDQAYIDILLDEDKELEEKIKVIYHFGIETILQREEKNIKELKSLNIYISGSDSRAYKIYNKSRSDVNMILTINPNTREILMTSIPRDYYVQVHGQNGLKDKLTHAGIYGLETSKATLEDLFAIEIDYSVKINFNAVVEIVDLVDGIDIYSDRTSNSFHKKGWIVNEGWNHMDGEKALAYARERYAYKEGDRHRIQNQQQVLEAVMKKIMSDKKILLKYDEVLDSLNNLYETTIPKELITLFVRDQLDTMPNWEFTTIRVSGSDASLPTYTAPNNKRYVMIPYEKDIKIAYDRITKVIEAE